MGLEVIGKKVRRKGREGKGAKKGIDFERAVCSIDLGDGRCRVEMIYGTSFASDKNHE